jgi:hypothetical protein
MVDIVQEWNRDLQRQHEQLKCELAQASKPKQRLVSKANRKFEAALALFSKLHQSLIRSDFKTLRDCLKKAIDKVVVNSAKQGRADGTDATSWGEKFIPKCASCTVQPGGRTCNRFRDLLRQLRKLGSYRNRVVLPAAMPWFGQLQISQST